MIDVHSQEDFYGVTIFDQCKNNGTTEIIFCSETISSDELAIAKKQFAEALIKAENKREEAPGAILHDYKEFCRQADEYCQSMLLDEILNDIENEEE